MRNGYHAGRAVTTAAGAVAVRQPRVNDKRSDPVTGQRLWGPSGGNLTELRIVESKYRIVHDPSYDWLVANHRYHVFKPGSLAPGTYEWRWEQRGWPDDPEGFAAATGSVIVPTRSLADGADEYRRTSVPNWSHGRSSSRASLPRGSTAD